MSRIISVPEIGDVEVPASYVHAEHEAHQQLWHSWWETPEGPKKEILREKFLEARRSFYLGYLYYKTETLPR